MTTQTKPPPPVSKVEPRRFTVADYYAMADAGILSENDRVELLDGDVIVMPPIGDWHASGVAQIIALFPSTILDGRAILQIQNPVRLDSDNEPQPDAMLLRWRNDFYRNGHPGPDDVLLLIEVSDTTVDYDRNTKLPRYARAGIPEVWIDNRRDRRIEAYTDPSGDEYATVRYAAPGETIAPQAFPDITLQVDRIIGD
jgi:Uma2 family endonuclease